VARQLEVFVGERPRLGEEDEHESVRFVSWAGDRDSHQRAVAGALGESAPFRREAVVVQHVPGREDAAVSGGGAQHVRRVG